MTLLTHLFDVKVSILGGALFHGLFFRQQPPQGHWSQDEGIYGYGCQPDIDEARRKVVSVLANWAPALFVAAERLLKGRDGKVIAAEALQRAQAGEGAGKQADLLLAVRVHKVQRIHGPR